MVLTDRLKRPSALAAAALLVVASLVPLLSSQKANAYGLVTERAIKLSSSALGASSTSYQVTFKAATTATVKSVAVDFCQNNPIINDSCTGTVGTNTPTLGSATVTTTGAPNNFSALTWTVALTNASRTFTISNATGVALTAGTAYTFTINLVTNPTDNDTVTGGNQPGTFYSRVLTFPNDVTSNYAGGYTATNVDTNVPTDAGGIALSTANQLTITAKVQERLTFCVYTSGTSCANGTGNSITLGDANGVLDNNTEYTNNSAKFGVSTNANGNTAACEDVDATVCSVVVRAKGGTLKSSPGCADGSGQTCSINPVGGTATTTAAGTEYFGLRVGSSGAPLVATTPYDGGTGTQFAFDDNNTTGTQSPYGDSIATFNAGTEQTGTLTFVGDIGATTEPGIYTTTLTFIATGTY